MQKKRSGLGKGLDALIPGNQQDQALSGVVEVPIGAIQPNPRQPRTQFDALQLAELADSIKAHGIIQPLIVSWAQGNDSYVLIAGERRLQAARQAGLEKVPVLLREATDQQYLELALIENIQRADLNAIEAAEAYRQLAEEFNLSHEEIAARVGKSRTAVTNTLRLLKLPHAIQAALLSEHISEGHARALLALPTAQAQAACLQTILEKALNVRQTEDLVRRYLGEKSATPARPPVDPEIKSLEDRLRSYFGTKVRVNHGQRGGSITIHYYSDEELDHLIDQLLEH
jgi:ParB family chromosome partitioning protein